MMKKLFLNILLIILTLALSACSQNKPVKQNFKFKISAVTAGIQLKGGSFVNAISETDTNLIKLDADHSAEFPSGIYEFQTISFEGPSQLMGKKYCGKIQKVDLSQPEKNVTMNITEKNCLEEPFISLIKKILKDFSASLPITVTNVSPKEGVLSGGTTITIIGSGFLPGATVSLKGVPCILPTVLSSTNIQCTTSANALGPADITVVNTDLQMGILSNAFTYVLPPPAPSELTLVPPATSSTPTINVKGVTTGHTIKIYSDIACTIERASGVASGSTINLISSALKAVLIPSISAL